MIGVENWMFPYLVRDRKWKNGYLCIAAREHCSGRDISQYVDRGTDREWSSYVLKIEAESVRRRGEGE